MYIYGKNYHFTFFKKRLPYFIEWPSCIYIYIYIYKYIYKMPLKFVCGLGFHEVLQTNLRSQTNIHGINYIKSNIGPVGRVFANGPEDLGSIPGRVISKTFKMVLDTSLLNTQQYKVSIKGKMEQSRERSSTLPYSSVL